MYDMNINVNILKVHIYTALLAKKLLLVRLLLHDCYKQQQKYKEELNNLTKLIGEATDRNWTLS